MVTKQNVTGVVTYEKNKQCGHQVKFTWCGYLKTIKQHNKLVNFILCSYLVKINHLGRHLNINKCGHQVNITWCGYLKITYFGEQFVF